MILPFDKEFPISQIFNDKRYRASYTKFGLLGHNGIDYATPLGTPVVAPHDGKIVENVFDEYGYGWYVKIENDREGSVLAHFKEQSPCKVGASVAQGELVGYSGNTGNSTGPHTHFGYYLIPRNRDNGFNGFIDQEIVFRVQKFLDELVDKLRLSGDSEEELRKSRNQWRADCKAMEKLYKDMVAQNNACDQTISEQIKLIADKDEKIKKYEASLVTNKTPLSKYSKKEILDELINRFKGVF